MLNCVPILIKWVLDELIHLHVLLQGLCDEELGIKFKFLILVGSVEVCISYEIMAMF